jgi:hypothetical protein
MIPKYRIGDIVELDVDFSRPGYTEGIEVNLTGRCKLYVVSQTVDCDGAPMYTVSDLPVIYPTDPALPPDARVFLMYHKLATVVDAGVAEDRLQPTGKYDRLVALDKWLEPLS